MHLPIRAAVLAVLAAPMVAQTIWNVPDGTDVSVVLAQASPGDVLQLATQHPPFVLNKGVLVRGSATNTQIISLGGPQPGPGSVTVAIPAGQRAGIERLFVTGIAGGSGFLPGTVTLQSGQCEVRDLRVWGTITVQGGSHVLQRIGPAGPETNLVIGGGTCSLSDSVLAGRTDSPVSGIFLYSSAIRQTGGQLLVSRLTATGGTIFTYSPTAPVPTVSVTGGSAYFTDSTIQGGNVGVSVSGPGTPALTGNGSVRVARTNLVPGTGTTPTPASSGYLVNPALVGMYCQSSPTLGASFTATVTAGNSQGWLAVIGGFDGTPNTLAPFVEPVFGNLAELVVLGVATPSAGAVLDLTLDVPNVPSLTGVAVFLQAVQQNGAENRASVLVGGTIR